MTIALLAALVAVNIAYLVLLDRKDARAQAERDADREERQTLLQRIQSPETAVYQHATKDSEPDGQGFPLSDEQVAEMEARQQAVSRIEALERGEFEGRIL